MVNSPPAIIGDTGSIPGLEDYTCQVATKLVGHNYLSP